MRASRRSSFPDRSAVALRWLAATACAVAIGATGAPATAAAARPCPEAGPATRDILVTWGLWGRNMESSLVWHGRQSGNGIELVRAGAVDDRVRQGLASGNAELLARTVRDRRGRGRNFLCADEMRVAMLPDLPRGTEIGGVSVNGRAIAWRTARRGRAAWLRVGRIAQGRVRAVRRTRAAATPRGATSEGRILVAPDGTATWAVARPHAGDGAPGVWVWPRGERPREIDVPADQRGEIDSVRLLDDQHVLLDAGTVPYAFRAPRPGHCPRLMVGRWQRLGAWRAALVPGVAEVGDEPTSSWAWSVVCDPATGRYVRIDAATSELTHYGGDGESFSRVVQAGPWLIVERIVNNGFAVDLVDTVSGTSQRLQGPVGGGQPLVPLPALPDPTGGLAPSPIPAVVVISGALAWTEEIAPRRYRVMLGDATGARTVGETDDPRLTLAGDLRWTAAGESRVVAVVPQAGWGLSAASLR